MLGAAHIEAWARRIYDRVTAGHSVEDSHVELKARIPEPERAAMRLAGHANSARGEAILWIVNLDEETGAIARAELDTARWFDGIKCFFDGHAPSLVDVIVSTPQGDLVALYVDTSRFPYLVWNPTFGTASGGLVEWEVPWREGTRVRSATRADLLALLAPRVSLPELEPLGAEVRIQASPDADGNNCTISLQIYVLPSSRDRLVIPFHRASMWLSSPVGMRVTLPAVRLEPPILRRGTEPVLLSKT